ncbi:tetratricopeptide repeat protein [Algibacter agarivorans]|uniref:tetratricopeptide repeat protein n=1 Tax=Algibacter agarivorans TaxID=1109741 RepID=UPI0031EE69BE
MKITNTFILFLVVFLSFSTTVLSQNVEIDSLKLVLQNHKENDTTRVNLLYKLAFDNFQRDLKLTKSYLGEAKALSNNLNYIKGKAKVSYLKGILESRKSNYEESLDFFKRSLKHYESIQDQSGIAAIYRAFGITHYLQAQYKEALVYYKKASEIHKDLGEKKELIDDLNVVANVYTVTAKYDEAILNYKEALKQHKLIDNKEGISSVHGNLGVLYKTQGNYPLAIDYYNKSLEYNINIGDTLGIARKLNNLGDVYNSIRKYDTALEYHNQSLGYSKKTGNKRLIAVNNGNIGNIYLHTKKYDKALEYYNIALEISQEINYQKQISINFHNIGEINVLINKPLIARENFIKAKDVSQKIDFKHVLSTSYLGISETYIREKKYKKALSFAQKGKKIADEHGLLESQKKASELLSEIYENLGSYKKALLNYQQFKILNDSLFNKENIEKIAQIEHEYKYKQALDSASIREFQLTKKITATNKDLEKSQRNYLWSVIGVLMVSMLLGSVIFYQKLRHAKAKTQNVEIEQKLLRSQMTPHFIFNSLSVLQGMILNKEAKKSVNYLSKFSKLLRITLENSRDKTVSLSEELKAIQNYLTLQNLENDSYQSTLLLEDTIDVPRFEVPPMLIQPFVENIIEHAFVDETDNRKIDIRLTFVNQKLICTITDNGIGYKYQKPNKNRNKKSLSTTITSERLKILSKDFKMEGSVTVEDRKKYNEQGTIVTLVIPHKRLVA